MESGSIFVFGYIKAQKPGNFQRFDDMGEVQAMGTLT